MGTVVNELPTAFWYVVLPIGLVAVMMYAYLLVLGIRMLIQERRDKRNED